ncbi:MAG: hypothetical protein ABI406_09285 [Ktedonobacteraceae bacterium]
MSAAGCHDSLVLSNPTVLLCLYLLLLFHCNGTIAVLASISGNGTAKGLVSLHAGLEKDRRDALRF